MIMDLRNSVLATFLSGVLMLTTSSCKETYPPTNLTQHSVIPLPASVMATNQTFVLDEEVSIRVEEGDESFKNEALRLAEMLRNATGHDFEVEEADKPAWFGNSIMIKKAAEGQPLPASGYVLDIQETQLSITALSAEGVFYGIQTLRQILPSQVEKTGELQSPVLIPTGIIRDWPQYEYRGMMLDVARHFFDVPAVKKVIDYLALYKINTLHLHLSDDQGWRIEIESWPNLTTHGGSTEVGGGEGGFFTKEDYKEIVAYAGDKHITIVPEIDMPGHTNAALASYPELNCDGKATELYTGMKVGFSTLCTDKEITYEFVNDVVREIAEMTPGPWFHIGGDESHSTEQEDYEYFMSRAREIVKSHGKQMIGWDEVAHADLDETDVVQFWAKEENALLGVQKGAKLLMSPSKHAYIDMKYDENSRLGLDWAGPSEVDDAYNWDPVHLVEGIEKVDILGVEAPLWAETIEMLDDIEYLMFPRILGIAEIGWTATENRRWDEYRVRLGQHRDRMKAMGIDFYESPLVPWQEEASFFMDIEMTGEGDE
ncbi:hexosaminidase [Marinilabilia salmonicolor]|jgi:hexosaminidase|uniref:beta-N-acetylhexosaminidase n=2 Tax=Marinilabilia salmonicolor TaxID=989 RepID=A0A368V8M5_9BACT|nr:hexosaminidase [Marinilabilia salmonicolor]